MILLLFFMESLIKFFYHIANWIILYFVDIIFVEAAIGTH